MSRLSIRARLDRCPRCDAATIHALTAPPAAWEVRTDPVPLDPPGEILALIAGRMTYDLVTTAGHQQLLFRDQFRITGRKWPVLATHTCPGPIPWHAIPAPAPRKSLPDNPPF